MPCSAGGVIYKAYVRAHERSGKVVRGGFPVPPGRHVALVQKMLTDVGVQGCLLKQLQMQQEKQWNSFVPLFHSC